MLTTGTAKAAYYSVAFKKRFKNYCEVIYSRKCYCHIVRTRRVLLRKYQRRQRQAFSLPQRVQRGTGKFEGKNSATEKLPKKGHSVRSHTRLPHHGKNGLLSSPVLSATRPRTWRGKTALAHAATLALPAAVRCGTVRYGTVRRESVGEVLRLGGYRGQDPGELERLHPSPASGLRKRLARLPECRTKVEASVPHLPAFRLRAHSDLFPRSSR